MEPNFDSLTSAFENSNTQLWEVFSLSDEELVKRVGRSVNEIRRFRSFYANQTNLPEKPLALSAAGLLETSVSTGVPALDTLLNGGIRRRSVIEINGPAGAGKTCLCAQIALTNSKEAIYFAAEERTQTICRRMKDIEDTNKDQVRTGGNSYLQCQFAQIRTASELRIGLNKLKQRNPPPSVIIVDSIASLFASVSPEDTLLDLEELSLQRVAYELDAAIVISNQVRDCQRPPSNLPMYHYGIQQLFVEGDASPNDELRKRPAYGMALSEHIGTRLVLSRRPASPVRTVRVVFSKYAAPASLTLEMTSAGLVASENHFPLDDGEDDSDIDLLTNYSMSTEPLTPVSI